MTANIEIQGLEEVVKKIEKLGRLDYLQAAIKASAAHVKGKVAQYPPSTAANAPGSKRWYERGYGSKWTRADGSIGGRKTSEMLGRKWTTETRNRGLTAVVGNNVSYGPYVQGEKQAAFHKARGWKTAEDVAKEETDEVVRFITGAINKIMAGG